MVNARLFWQGYRAALPLIIGVVPFGIVFGAVAVTVGMSAFEAVGMSLFVFAGSAQFVVTQLIGDGASLLLIVLITFLMNLRNFLYSASLAPFFRSLSTTARWLLAFPVVDESYALIINRTRQSELSALELGWFAMGVSANLMIVWLASTGLGTILSDILPSHLTETLGFTLPLIFTTFIVQMLVTRPAGLAALSAAVAGILLSPLPHHLGLLIAAIVGIGVGILAEKKLMTETGVTQI